MQEILVSLVGFVALLIFGAILSLAVADHFWGTTHLGGLVKPRKPLISEGNPWWMQSFMMYLSITAIFVICSLLAFVYFIPFALSDALPFLITFLLLMVVLLLCSVYNEYPQNGNVI